MLTPKYLVSLPSNPRLPLISHCQQKLVKTLYLLLNFGKADDDDYEEEEFFLQND